MLAVTNAAALREEELVTVLSNKGCFQWKSGQLHLLKEQLRSGGDRRQKPS